MKLRHCPICQRKLSGNPYLVDMRDGRMAFIGAECFKRVKAVGADGLNGYWLLPAGYTQQEIEAARKRAINY